MRQTFRKEERLKSTRAIKQLFASGHSFLSHPFKVNWMLHNEMRKYPARILISVSKKNFRKASERNHIKRLIREAYRKNKITLYNSLQAMDLNCDISLVYIGREIEEYSSVEKKIIKALKRLISELELYQHQNIKTP